MKAAGCRGRGRVWKGRERLRERRDDQLVEWDEGGVESVGRLLDERLDRFGQGKERRTASGVGMGRDTTHLPPTAQGFKLWNYRAQWYGSGSDKAVGAVAELRETRVGYVACGVWGLGSLEGLGRD